MDGLVLPLSLLFSDLHENFRMLKRDMGFAFNVSVVSHIFRFTQLKDARFNYNEIYYFTCGTSTVAVEVLCCEFTRTCKLFYSFQVLYTF